MNESMTNAPLRHVVIGVGAGIFNSHRLALTLDTTELVAVCDVNPDLGQAVAEELEVPFYTDHRAMLADTKPDVAVVITPHPFHASIAIDALAAGCHVLVEKPIAVQVSEADAMIEAAQKADRLLAVNFQQRLRPEIQAAYKLLQDGQLGQIQYVNLTVTWPRTRSYFEAAGWRGTWKGEGGGLLMNQVPHNLDLLCYFMGLPERVFAWTKTTLHEIETEDTAQAMLAWPDGAMGSVHASTAETGLPSRFEILGTGGSIRMSGSELTFERFETDMLEHIAHGTNMYRGPETLPQEVEMGSGSGDHLAIYRNLHAAILEGKPVIADGVSSRIGLEVANAMIYSSHTGQEVSLPLDRQKYAALLERLQSGE